MNDASQLLNSSLKAYVQTVPHAKRLHFFLIEQGCEGQREVIEAELAGLISAADDFLYGQQPGTKWNADFSERFYGHLQAKYPWLERDAFRVVGAYGQWLSWHEGLGL